MRCRWVRDPLRLLRDDRGGVAAYAAMAALTAIGAGAVAVDVGRAAILRTQMQNAVDARAMAAAAQLDGRDGARTRATTVAKNVMASRTAIAADSENIKVKDPIFYSQYTPTKVLATTDQDAAVVEVTLEANGWIICSRLSCASSALAPARSRRPSSPMPLRSLNPLSAMRRR